MGYYAWYVDDSSDLVKAGAVGLVFTEVIQENDGYGGYNTSFSIAGKTGQYHIHFKSGGTRVNCFRYKSSSSDATGTNLFKFIDNSSGEKPQNLSDLMGTCGTSYPNYVKLFENVKAAIKDAPKKPNQELATPTKK
ncbi:MAG TPA: hypothetical protein VFW00_07530 [Rhodocyclaceae bacterium]|nr:hypothetical protein [Rhodocyclaceae bacterium]